MKVASAYLRQQTVYLYPFSKSEVGFWMATPPFLRCSPHNPEQLGLAVSQSLATSQEDSVLAPSGDDFLAPLYEMAGVTDWQEFCQSALSVGIRLRDDVISLIPQRSLGPNKEFVPIFANAIALPVGASDLDIGNALMETFRRCA